MSSLSWALPRPARRRAAFGQIALNEFRLVLRQPGSLIGGIVFPVVLLVIFGAIPSFRQSAANLGGLTPLDVYVPILIVLSLALLTMFGLPMPLTTYRQMGLLRRLSTTPVPPWWLLAAQGVVQLCVALTGIVILLVTSITVYGALVPKSPGALTLSIALTVAGLFPIGLLIASVAKTAYGASIIGRLAFFPVVFFAGLWLPRELMPGVLQGISDYTPLGAAVEAMQDSMQGQFPPVAPLLVLAGYALVFGFLAKRFFSWE